MYSLRSRKNLPSLIVNLLHSLQIFMFINMTVSMVTYEKNFYLSSSAINTSILLGLSICSLSLLASTLFASFFRFNLVVKILSLLTIGTTLGVLAYFRSHFPQTELLRPKQLTCLIMFIVNMAMGYLRSNGGKSKIRYQIQVVNKASLLPLILPLVPLLNYYVANRHFFSLTAAAEFFAVLGLMPILVCRLFFPFVEFLKIDCMKFQRLVLSAVFSLYALPAITAAASIQDAQLYQIFFALVLVTYGFFYQFEKFSSAAIFVFSATILLAPIIGLFQNKQNRDPSHHAESKGTDLDNLLAASPKRRPDIYLLVFDAYASESHLSDLGIDNSNQIRILKGHGFKFYNENYTTAIRTMASISRVFEMSPNPQNHIVGWNRVIRSFSRWGYSTNMMLHNYHLSGTTSFGPKFIYPLKAKPVGVAAIIDGIISGRFDSRKVINDYSYSEWVNVKRKILDSAANSTAPFFLYAHSLATHHFGNDSHTCKGDEIYRYRDALKVANQEMEMDINEILRNGRDSIIVVAGDHGPAALSCSFHDLGESKSENISRLEMADIFSSFLAIRWPESAPNGYDQISVLQDVFFAIFAYMLEDPRIFAQKSAPATFYYTDKIPYGAVTDGKLTIGRDRGKKLLNSSPKL